MLDRQTCRELGVPQYVKLPIPAYAIQILPENYDLLRREERLDSRPPLELHLATLCLAGMVVALALEIVLAYKRHQLQAQKDPS